MPKTHKPKFQRVYALISSALDKGEFDESRHLPSVAVLAAECGVSRFTLWQVIKQLKREGRIQGSPRHRFSVPVSGEGAAQLPDPARTIRRSKHRDLQKRIQGDILNGHLAYNVPLPPAKILAARYGVSRMTLRKALLELAQKTVLSHRGTRFCPASIVTPASAGRSRIMLLGLGPDMGRNILWGYWHLECLKFLELECRRANLDLDIVCFTRNDTGLLLVNGRTGEPYTLEKDPAILGSIYEASGAESVDDELLHTLSGWEQPVAILDEYGAWPSKAYLGRHANVRVFRNTIADLPGQQVARFVLELGHRTAVFISPFHSFEYSLKRLAILRREFNTAGNARLVPITDQYDPGKWELYAARINMDGMTAFYDEWKKNLPHAYTSVMDDHFILLYAKMHEGRQREHLDRLFNRALEINGVTVWIMVNDASASYALDFLTQRGIAVPRDLSIISFDDLPEALQKGITSFNFNYVATMQAILRFITNPRLFPSRKPVVEIEGEIIPRRTTAGPRAVAG